MRKAIYAGSFDPLTNGHLDIILRSSKMFDEIHIVCAVNKNKSSSFTQDEKIDMINKVLKNKIKNVVVTSTDKLIVAYAKEHNINILIRGLRNIKDYEDEYTLASINKDLDKNIETILLFPSKKNQMLSSSMIKELVSFNQDISLYVPSEIKDFVYNKLSSK